MMLDTVNLNPPPVLKDLNEFISPGGMGNPS